VVHPQSIVHSLVEFVDGSVLAQLGIPDMRSPIAVAMAHPERLPLALPRLDLTAVGRFDFETPDTKRFPCLDLAYAALASDEAAPAVLNAANEVAVEAFLAGGIRFPDIAAIDAVVLAAHTASSGSGALRDLSDVAEADAWARARAGERVAAARAQED
jgi:1-deoxy-D-xylulose-5-phosphate reductoisomerase